MAQQADPYLQNSAKVSSTVNGLARGAQMAGRYTRGPGPGYGGEPGPRGRAKE